MSEPYDDLLSAPRRDLERLLLAGQPLAPERLAGHRYRGIALVARLPFDRAFLKFAVSFEAGPDGRVLGAAAPVHQDGLLAPWTERRRPKVAARCGRFAVLAPGAPGRDDGYPRALRFDFAQGSPALSPLSRIQAVAAPIDHDRPELLLGRALLALGPWRLATPHYFLLAR